MEIGLYLDSQRKPQCKKDYIRLWETSLIKHEKQPFQENDSPSETHEHKTKSCWTISTYQQKLAYLLFYFILCNCHPEMKPNRLWLKASADKTEKKWTYPSSMNEVANKATISRKVPENTYNKYFTYIKLL